MKSHYLFFMAATLLASALPLQAAPFAFNNGDVQLVFTQPGRPNLEVDVGPVSQFLNAAPGTPIAINEFNSTQLNTAFASLAGVNWAAVSTVRGSPVYGLPLNTLFLTNPRLNVNSPTAPYTSQNSFKQAAVGSIIDTAAGYGSSVGAILWSSGTPPSPVTNTADVVIIPQGDESSYASIAGTSGDLAGNFTQGNIENQTPNPFTSGVTRSDFYELTPGSGAGTFLGYFEFSAGGTLTFNPAIPGSYLPLTQLAVVGANAVLSFTTTNGPLYDVQSTTDLVSGAWSTIATNLAGTGGVLTYTDTGGATVPKKFYRVNLHF
jgi:hypothetical protein